MNRKIVFRAKEVSTNKWVFGDLIQYENGDTAIFDKKMTEYGCEATQICRRTKVVPDTIGQFTGLYDKNQNAIYEGDIVRFYELETTGFSLYEEQIAWFKEVAGVVVHDEGMFCIESEEIVSKFPLSWSGFHSLEEALEAISGMDLGEGDTDRKGNKIDSHLVGIEVIGNKFDNPELLEE